MDVSENCFNLIQLKQMMMIDNNDATKLTCHKDSYSVGHTGIVNETCVAEIADIIVDSGDTLDRQFYRCLGDVALLNPATQ